MRFNRNHHNSFDEEPGPARLEYAGWEALSRIIPGFGRPPRPAPVPFDNNPPYPVPAVMS